MITCGHAPLLNPEIRSMFERIARNLVCIMDAGWETLQHWDDPVQWRRRDRNVVSDFLVNYTMEKAESWSETFDWPFPGKDMNDCVLLAHSDGGTRYKNCSASAWIVEVALRHEGRL